MYESSNNDDLQLKTEITTLTSNSELDDHQTTNTQLPEIIVEERMITGIIEDNNDIESSSYASYIIPLKIILPLEHVHKSKNSDSFDRFNYILLNIDDVSYHEHIYSDNSDQLLPVLNSSTIKPSSENEELITEMTNIQSDGHDSITDSLEINENDDLLLVDSQGYYYELGKLYQIKNEEGTPVVEFNEIEMKRPKVLDNQITKIISSTIKPTIQTTTETPRDQYEGHYAKIFQWLNYHL